MSSCHSYDKKVNDTVLANFQLPEWLLNEFQNSIREEEKIKSLKSTAERCRSITEHACSSLNRFISQVESINNTFTPLNTETKKVIRAQNNIQQTIKEVKLVYDNMMLVQNAEASFSSERIQNDYVSFLVWLRSLQSAVGFWTRNIGFRDADKAIRHLKSVITKAVKGCNTEFSRLLSGHTRPIDPEVIVLTLKMNKTAAEENNADSDSLNSPEQPNQQNLHMLEMLPASLVIRLNTLVLGMEGWSCRDFIDILVKNRSLVLKNTIRGLADVLPIEDSSDPYQSYSGISQLSNVPTDFMKNKSKSKTAKSGSSGSYVRGSHAGLKWISALLLIFESEIELWTDILEGTSLDSDDFDNAYGVAIIDGLQSWLKRVEMVVKNDTQKDPYDRLLKSLDILDYLQKNMRRIRNIIRKSIENSDHMSLIAELRQSLYSQIHQTLHEIVSGSLSGDKTKLRNDGTVAAICVETTSLVRTLSNLTNELDLLPGEFVYDALNALNSVKKGKVLKYEMPKLVNIDRRLTCVSLKSFIDDETLSTIVKTTTKVPNTLSVSEAVKWSIIIGLEYKLEFYSRNLRHNPALSSLFLLNNIHHIINTCSKFMKNPAFVEYYTILLHKARINYVEATWGKLLSAISLNDKDTVLKNCTETNVPSKAKNAIKRKFTIFNEELVRIVTEQSRWSVPDSNIRGQLRADNIDVILPRYQEFLAVYTPYPFTTKPTKYIMYKPEVVETMANKLYDEMS